MKGILVHEGDSDTHRLRGAQVVFFSVKPYIMERWKVNLVQGRDCWEVSQISN